MASTPVDLHRGDRDPALRSGGSASALRARSRSDGFLDALEEAVRAGHEIDAAERAPARYATMTSRPGMTRALPGGGSLDERVQQDAVIRLRAGAVANPGLLALLADDYALLTDDQAWPAGDEADGAEDEDGAGVDGSPEPAAIEEISPNDDEISPQAIEGRPAAASTVGDGEVTGAESGDDVAQPEHDEPSHEVVASVEEAVRVVLGAPDLACLITPPGARLNAVGALVRAAAARGERVLIAAPASADLDALVACLPAGPSVIRTDRSGMEPGTLAAGAAVVQQQILARSQEFAGNLERWGGDPSPAMGWLCRLRSALREAGEARQAADEAAVRRNAVVAATRARLGSAVRERKLAVRLAARRPATSRRWWRWGGGAVREDLREVLDRAVRDYEESVAALDAAVEQDSAVRAAADRAAFARIAAERTVESAERSALQLSRWLTGIGPVPAAGDDGDLWEWTADVAGLTRFAERIERVEPTLRARAGLMREWRQRAARPSRQLHAELLRYADVVATTCLGAGRPEYGDHEFDLVILPDAARVPVPVALVPMVRARRAVLVGEPGRTPLRDGRKVGEWLRGRGRLVADPAEVASLLTESVLDRLAGRAPAGRRVRIGAPER
ncbi:AAA domain-containing protein [Actinoplanes rectilineatus]|uniref:AAA domain-containing protein n=1 Tax=Actinoplanes rectilineatus TaxID=113571 RepID=UPI0014707F56|nr:AAA domain-containing protein [Actinoplanes rectilineatus]